MELKEVFRGRWLWLLLTIPLFTAVLAGVTYLGSVDEEWESTGEFSIREFAPGETAGDIRAVTSSFNIALGSRRVAEAIDAIPDVDVSRSFVEMRSAGEGGDLEVALVASSPESAEAALDVGVRQALSIVADAERRRISRQLVAADAAAEQAIEVLLELEDEAGVANLAEEAARRSADILALRNQIASAAGSEVVQSALQQTLEEKQVELDIIEGELLRWTSIEARLTLAVQSGADESLRLQQVATALAALENEPVLSSIRTTQVSDVQPIIRVAMAAAIGSAFVIVVLALLSGWGRSGMQPTSGQRPPERPRRSTAADVSPRA